MRRPHLDARPPTAYDPRAPRTETFRPGRSVALTPVPSVPLAGGRDRTVGHLALRLLLADGLVPPPLAALLEPALLDLAVPEREDDAGAALAPADVRPLLTRSGAGDRPPPPATVPPPPHPRPP